MLKKEHVPGGLTLSWFFESVVYTSAIAFIKPKGGEAVSESTRLLPEDVPDSVVRELVTELRGCVKDLDALAVGCACGGHEKTMRQLIRDIEERTPDGMELIRAHLKSRDVLNVVRPKRPWWRFW